MKTSTVSEKGWVVIPQEIRERFGLKKGDKVVIEEYGGVIVVVPASRNPVKETAGMLKGNASLLEALLEERRLDAKIGK